MSQRNHKITANYSAGDALLPLPGQTHSDRLTAVVGVMGVVMLVVVISTTAMFIRILQWVSVLQR
ncbi:hypothetical protein E2C01_062244 [Portunus trituberculatus]|uniref:Uncharacterized protein n=1 Tax=Portunus trituberculatus TaxID=210409 RepID=A0A5B7HHH5_PORTR|nr:hypothetical protein [Portunus trituberculatus]